MLTVTMNINVIQADTIDTVGQEPYEQCGYCHEYDGNSRMSLYPKLAGQTSEYIVKQLKDFREGKRTGQMQATAELLSDDEINIVARYFSQQKTSHTKQPPLSGKQNAIAQTLFFKGDSKRNIPSCTSCHGTGGQGIGVVPKLASQHESYIYKQLNEFKTGARRNDNRLMAKFADKLTDLEIKSLSAYLSRKQSLNEFKHENNQ